MGPCSYLFIYYFHSLFFIISTINYLLFIILYCRLLSTNLGIRSVFTLPVSRLKLPILVIPTTYTGMIIIMVCSVFTLSVSRLKSPISVIPAI